MKIPILAPTILLLILLFCKERPSHAHYELAQQAKEDTLTTQFKSLIEDIWNKRDLEKLPLISAENHIKILNGAIVAENRNALQASLKVFFTGFPDGKMVVDRAVVKEEHLTAHWTFTGTHTGIFGDLPPTGKKVKVSGCSAIQFDQSSKIIREEVFYNELELLQQLGYTLTPPILK